MRPLRTLLRACLLSPALLLAQDPHGSTEEGEGSELVVTQGVVVREVAAEEEGSLPLLAVGTETGMHFLYDPNRVIHVGLWTGLFGRETEGVFTPALDRLRSFSLEEKAPPWSYGEKPRMVLTSEWKGYRVEDGRVHFQYRLLEEGSDRWWEVDEVMEYVSETVQKIHFQITASAPSELYLNYWVMQTDFRRLITNGQQNARNKIKNLHPNQEAFTITFERRREGRTLPNGYRVTELEVPNPPSPSLFEPTDIGFADDGTAFTSTRTGSVWRHDGEAWTVFADGLNEINGIKVLPDGSGAYVMQKPELTLVKDTDGDQVADLYQTVEDRFRFTGQYHEFAYGPEQDSQGALYFSTGLSSSGFHTATGTTQNQMTTPLGYRGWVMRHNPDGSLTPFAAGLRSPAGIGMNARDELFVTDNQGDWVASSYLGHVEEGDFLGHPVALYDRSEFGFTPALLDHRTLDQIPETVPLLDPEEFGPQRKLPAVWLSHGDLTNSPGHPSFAPEEGFGPFGGQAFIADIAHRNLVRVALEKVGGEYQGAVFPFIRPLKSASYSTQFDPEGNLWVGSVGRGWTAGDPAIEIIRFDPGQTPFEMHHIALTRDGFDIVFTEALAEEQSIQPADVSVTEYRYRYWQSYGSEREEVASLNVNSLRLSDDRKTLSLTLPRQAEFIYEIELPELRSASGLTLLNTYGVYTLNQLLP